MKVTIDIDCTPEEARVFFGLPDVKPIQDAMMDEVKAKMQSGMQGMDMESLMKTWMPTGIQGLEQFQKMFWSGVSQAASGGTSDGKKK